MKYRSIKQILPAAKINMGGIFLDQALPVQQLDALDPFLLIHHWNQKFDGGQHQRDVGVGPHPHRGFSPVTFIYEGGVHHRDTTGFSEVVGPGGTQWMNSGAGLIHSERPTKEVAENGGVFELIQFWVNTPAKHKMDAPKYHPLTKAETPVIVSADKKTEVFVVSGIFEDVKGPIPAKSPLTILRVNMRENGVRSLELPTSFNSLLYLLNGRLTLNNEVEISDKMLVQFGNGQGLIHVVASKDARFIVLSGEPINEPVKSYGPFVMNTDEELNEAIRDYQKGEMGNLIEVFD